MEGQPAPRKRRADRYTDQEVPPPIPAREVRPFSPVQQQADTMERPMAARKQSSPRKVRSEWSMPVWLTRALSVVLLLNIALFAATCLMNGWLTENIRKKQAEEQRILDAHPMGYRNLIEQYAEEYNLQPSFVCSLILNESSFRTDAESNVGARGLMQLMPNTAEWIAHKLKVNAFSFDRMYDAESNIRFGCWYLNYLSRLYNGDPVCVACAYHAGQGQVNQWLIDTRYSDDEQTLKLESLIDGPTRNYARKVTQDYGIYQVLYYTPEMPADKTADQPGSET